MLKHRKDYADLHRTTEQERDSIEHEVSFQAYPLKPLSEIVRSLSIFFFFNHKIIIIGCKRNNRKVILIFTANAYVC